jgi:hypothetical protein
MEGGTVINICEVSCELGLRSEFFNINSMTQDNLSKEDTTPDKESRQCVGVCGRTTRERGEVIIKRNKGKDTRDTKETKKRKKMTTHPHRSITNTQKRIAHGSAYLSTGGYDTVDRGSDGWGG